MVKEQIASGVDYIKNYMEKFQPVQPYREKPKLSLEIVAAIIDEVRSSSKSVGLYCENAVGRPVLH